MFALFPTSLGAESPIGSEQIREYVVLGVTLQRENAELKEEISQLRKVLAEAVQKGFVSRLPPSVVQAPAPEVKEERSKLAPGFYMYSEHVVTVTPKPIVLYAEQRFTPGPTDWWTLNPVELVRSGDRTIIVYEGAEWELRQQGDAVQLIIREKGSMFAKAVGNGKITGNEVSGEMVEIGPVSKVIPFKLYKTDRADSLKKLER